MLNTTNTHLSLSLGLLNMTDYINEIDIKFQ